MNIVFLHGLESTPETTRLGNAVKKSFNNVVIPDYLPKSGYLQTRVRLSKIFNDIVDPIVIGTSIGGFWALKSTEFTNINKVILINPAIMRACDTYGVKMNTRSDVLGKIILNMDDDIINNKENFDMYENRFSITTFDKGGHRVENVDEIIPEIRRSIDFLSVWIP